MGHRSPAGAAESGGTRLGSAGIRRAPASLATGRTRGRATPQRRPLRCERVSPWLPVWATGTLCGAAREDLCERSRPAEARARLLSLLGLRSRLLPTGPATRVGENCALTGCHAHGRHGRCDGQFRGRQPTAGRTGWRRGRRQAGGTHCGSTGGGYRRRRKATRGAAGRSAAAADAVPGSGRDRHSDAAIRVEGPDRQATGWVGENARSEVVHRLECRGT